MIFFQAFHNRPGRFCVDFFLRSLSILFVLGFLAPPAVFAQDASPASAGEQPSAVVSGPETSGPMTAKQQLQQKIGQMRQLEKQKKQVHQEVLRDNPELKKEGEDYVTLVRTTLAENLAARGVDVQRLKELQTRLRAEDISREEKSRLEKEYREKVGAYQRVHQQTMNSPQIRGKREELVHKIEEKNPRAAEIEQKLTALQQEIRKDYARMLKRQQRQQQKKKQ